MSSDQASSVVSSSAVWGPLLNTELLVISDERAEDLQATFEYFLDERLAVVVYGVVHER